jgi:putative transposase
VQYFNRRYDRTGTLWQGRYKSCLVESGEHMLDCYRYVDTLAAISGVVTDPFDYPWSSFRQHIGAAPHFVQEHAIWSCLADSEAECFQRYCELAVIPLASEVVKEININVVQGSVYGTEEFRAEIENRCGQKVRPRPRGRPRLRRVG